jgi:L-asparaginase
MKILIILTGGTIGSRIDNHIIDTGLKSPYRLIDLYYSRYGTEIQFDTFQPFSYLSENFTINTVNMLADSIRSINSDEYDGIIITHGSDTVSYTASFLSYMFCSLKCPLVLIASDYPPDDIKSNAVRNLRGAVQFIKSGYVKNGVYFAYGNPCENVRIHIGTRINEADCFTDRFSSFCNLCFGEIISDEFVSADGNPLPCDIEKSVLYNNTVLKPCCLIIKSFTGMDYSLIDINNKNLKSIINIMYHSATACTFGTDTSFTEFIKRCSNVNVKVYCTSFKNKNDIYASAKNIIDCGGIPLYNISYQSAYAKAVLSESNDDKNIMDKNIFFEHI